MDYLIHYQRKKVGHVHVEICDIWVSFQAECVLQSLDVFRCYGKISGHKPLLLGVLEPEEGRGLTLSRSFSMTQLHQQGAYPDLPTEYFLLGASELLQPEKAEALLETEYADVADPLIMACLQKGQMQKQGNTVFAPFQPGQENPMAFLLAVCRLEKREGVFYAVYDLSR